MSDSTEEATRPPLFSSIQNRLRVVLPLHLRSTSSLRVVTSFGLGPLGGNRIETPAQSADCPFQKPAGYGTQPRPNHTLVPFSLFSHTYGHPHSSPANRHQPRTDRSAHTPLSFVLPILTCDCLFTFGKRRVDAGNRGPHPCTQTRLTLLRAEPLDSSRAQSVRGQLASTSSAEHPHCGRVFRLSCCSASQHLT